VKSDLSHTKGLLGLDGRVATERKWLIVMGLSALTGESPLLPELDVELGSHQDSNEHAHKSSPSEDDLNGPTCAHRWEGGQLLATTVADIPEHVSARSRTWARGVWCCWPRTIRKSTWILCICQAHLRVGAAAELPRTNDENPHWLDVHENCGKQCPQRGRMHLQAGTSSALLAPPPHKLCEVKHHRHH